MSKMNNTMKSSTDNLNPYLNDISNNVNINNEKKKRDSLISLMATPHRKKSSKKNEAISLTFGPIRTQSRKKSSIRRSLFLDDVAGGGSNESSSSFFMPKFGNNSTSPMESSTIVSGNGEEMVRNNNGFDKSKEQVIISKTGNSLHHLETNQNHQQPPSTLQSSTIMDKTLLKTWRKSDQIGDSRKLSSKGFLEIPTTPRAAQRAFSKKFNEINIKAINSSANGDSNIINQNNTHPENITRRKSTPRDILKNLARYSMNNDKVESKAQPTSHELDKQLEVIMSEREFKEVEKNKLRKLTHEEKWTLIMEFKEAAKCRISPRDYISNLRKKPDDAMDHLHFMIKGESLSWVREFIKLGGVNVITKILDDVLEKQKKKSKPIYYQLIQNSIYVLKALLQIEEGIKAVLENFKTLDLLFASLDLALLSERTKIHLLHILAAISTLNENANTILLSILEKNQISFISLACSVHEELAAATFTCINAILKSASKDSRKDRLKQSLQDKGLRTIVKQWQEQKEISKILGTQLSIFTKADKISNDNSTKTLEIEQQDSPLPIVKKLLDQIKGTPLLNLFVSTVIHLLEINPVTQGGRNKWEIINLFVKCSAMVSDKNEKNDAYNNILSQFKNLHESIQSLDQSADVELVIDEKRLKKKISLETIFSPPLSGPLTPFPESDTNLPPEPIVLLNEVSLPPPTGSIPPPPPGIMKNRIGKKEIHLQPDIKMRPYYWNKLNITSVSDTIWGRMQKEIQIPKDLLQNEFSYIENDSTTMPKEPSNKNETKTLIILDPKRWQNISILLSKFPIKNFTELHNAIFFMDHNKLDQDSLQLLIPFVPTSTEIEKLKFYKHTQSEHPCLGLPEKFFLVLMDIPEVEIRLKLWQFKLTFQTNYMELKQRDEYLINACSELRSSDKFTSVLEIILYFGNFLNCNTTRGGAWGFKLESLLRLSEIKSKSNPDKTILYILVEYIKNEHPELSDFYHDLKSIEKVKDIQQLSSLSSEIGILDNQLKELQQFFNSQASVYGHFRQYMQSFIPEAQNNILSLKDLHKKASADFTSILQFFGESNGIPVGTFFGTIHRFLLSFESTKFKLSREATMTCRQNLGKLGLEMPVSEGTLDRVIDELKSGQAFDF